jgi:Fe2+ transport system protein FeoA
MLNVSGNSINPIQGAVQAFAIEHALADDNRFFISSFFSRRVSSILSHHLTECKEYNDAQATCVEKAKRRTQNLYALSDLKQGVVGKVSFIRAESPILERIIFMGLSFGAIVAVETTSDDVLEINLGNFNVLMGQDVAAKIFVELPQK